MSSNDPNGSQILKDIAIRQQEAAMKQRIVDAAQKQIYNSSNIKKA